jgi:hypothetical protein
MVIRFPRLRLATLSSVARRDDEVRLETHPSGLNRTDARRLSRREIEHRERMLRHLELVYRDR